MEIKNILLGLLSFLCAPLVVANQKSLKIGHNEMIVAWEQFFKNNKWQDLIRDQKPIACDVGTLYIMPNFLNRPNEGLQIIDMSGISYSEPHYHHKQTTIYIVLQGNAVVVNGENTINVKIGDVVVLPPEKAHFTLPGHNFVIACI